eukprot:TRINITY_DN8552_c0_g2_i2.p1 TRINITY_DN8552_c0_g2~~TRINITY_DN8552_c0_g2_i2.p1  ORF type:complete len:394 (-),score=74.19 TRINITY_DN8552_c0_g2_i2:66-1247(-)
MASWLPLFVTVWFLALDSAAAVFLKGSNSWCTMTMKVYGVVPGRTWGRLDVDAVKEEWHKNKCDAVLQGSNAVTLLEKETWCTDVQKAHGIIPGLSWGTLTSDQERAKWGRIGCDNMVKIASASTEDVTVALLKKSPSELAHKWCTDAQHLPTTGSNFEHAWQSFDCDNLLSADVKESPDMWCWNKGRQKGVVPGSSWGSLTDDQDRQTWGRFDCDKLFSERSEKAREELLAGKVPALLGLTESGASDWCREKGIQHGVELGTTWGTLRAEQRAQWKTLGCDRRFAQFAEKERLVLLANNANLGTKRHVSLLQKDAAKYEQPSVKKIKPPEPKPPEPNQHKKTALVQQKSYSVTKSSAFLRRMKKGMMIVRPPVHKHQSGEKAGAEEDNIGQK